MPRFNLSEEEEDLWMSRENVRIPRVAARMMFSVELGAPGGSSTPIRAIERTSSLQEMEEYVPPRNLSNSFKRLSIGDVPSSQLPCRRPILKVPQSTESVSEHNVSQSPKVSKSTRNAEVKSDLLQILTCEKQPVVVLMRLPESIVESVMGKLPRNGAEAETADRHDDPLFAIKEESESSSTCGEEECDAGIMLEEEARENTVVANEKIPTQVEESVQIVQEAEVEKKKKREHVQLIKQTDPEEIEDHPKEKKRKRPVDHEPEEKPNKKPKSVPEMPEYVMTSVGMFTVTNVDSKEDPFVAQDANLVRKARITKQFQRDRKMKQRKKKQTEPVVKFPRVKVTWVAGGMTHVADYKPKMEGVDVGIQTEQNFD